jgi:hypothetical protein
MSPGRSSDAGANRFGVDEFFTTNKEEPAMQATQWTAESDPENSDMKAFLIGTLLQIAQKAGNNDYNELSDELFYLTMKWSQRANWSQSTQPRLKSTKGRIGPSFQ